MKISGVKFTGGINVNTSAAPSPGPSPGPTPSGGYQGSNFGYSAGGINGSGSIENIIQKYSFTSDANATDVGDLTVALEDTPAGSSSSTHGYASGGRITSGPTITTIQKWTFTSDGNATDVGVLTAVRKQATGQTSSTHGYASGGMNPAFTPANLAGIDKFPFASDSNASESQNLITAANGSAGQSSNSHGYTSGGGTPAGRTQQIQKFSFASSDDATNVGNLSQNNQLGSGSNSDVSGYNSGGNTDAGGFQYVNRIEKFPFSTDSNSVSVGVLTQARGFASGSSSTSSGYTAGGLISPPLTVQNIIDKVSFASDTNATDVGDLVQAVRGIHTGSQY